MDTSRGGEVETQRATRWYLSAMVAMFALIVIPLSIVGVVGIVNDDGPAGAAAPIATTVPVTMNEFAFGGTLTAPAGDITLSVTNTGSAPHTLLVRGGPRTGTVNPGETVELALGQQGEGTLELLCDVAGHEGAGMKTHFVVHAPSAGASAAASNSHGGHGEMDYAEMDRLMDESIARFPAPTKGKGAQPLEPTITADGVKQFEITAKITPWEVAPGKVVDAWTYNGQVPGPLIKVAVGDRVRLVLRNELPMGTDVHIHGIDLEHEMDGVAPITQPVVAPGESFTYSFTATRAAVAMYHAHHMGQMQVPNGLFAPLLIGDVAIPTGRTISGISVPEGVVPAAEIPMVVNDAGVIGLSLNGKSFPATEPYPVKQGDWVVIHYYNEGLQVHPMHLHQFPQLVIAKDGFPLDAPYAADTINVAPGERYTVLVHADKAGTWVWHCHVLNHVESDTGMFGMVTAMIVS